MDSTHRTDSQQVDQHDWATIREVTLPGRAWPESPLSRVLAQGVGAAWGGLSRGVRFLRDVAAEVGVPVGESGNESSIERRVESFLPVKPLMVLLSDTARGTDWASNLAAVSSVVDGRWSEEARPTDVYDAVLHLATGVTGDVLVLKTTIHPGKDAAIADWAHHSEPDSGFAHLFPLRQDCATLTLPLPIQQADLRLTRLLIDAACLLSRHPSRTRTSDRLNGRGANWHDTSTMHPGGEASLNMIMTALQSELERRRSLPVPMGEAAGIAARLLSAWAGVSTSITARQRRECVDLAASMLPHDCFVGLRRAAIVLGELDDSRGMELLRGSATSLRERDLRPLTDQTPFLHAELESGMGHPASIGRVAAGLTLACAAMSEGELRMYLDDLRDEMKFSNALLGKDQDRFLLEQVATMLRELAHADAVANGDAPSPANEETIATFRTIEPLSPQRAGSIEKTLRLTGATARKKATRRSSATASAAREHATKRTIKAKTKLASKGSKTSATRPVKKATASKRTRSTQSIRMNSKGTNIRSGARSRRAA